jgi:hypothetical protein
MRCAARCGRIVADMTGQDAQAAERMALTFLNGAARRRASGVGPEQARQEALHLAFIHSQLGIEPTGLR